MHAAAYAFVASVAAQRPAGPVLEIGARDINGTIRELFADDPYLAIDVAPGPGVDVVADGATFTPAAPQACIVCCEVLEHTAAAAAICAHAHTLLQPGGVFIVTAAGPGRAPHSAIDGGPLQPGEFYANVAPADLALWLAAFVDVAVTVNDVAGDVYAIARKAGA